LIGSDSFLCGVIFSNQYKRLTPNSVIPELKEFRVDQWNDQDTRFSLQTMPLQSDAIKKLRFRELSAMLDLRVFSNPLMAISLHFVSASAALGGVHGDVHVDGTSISSNGRAQIPTST